MKRQQVIGITIDSSSTRDIDDAIWVEKLADPPGTWRVTISIADVGSRVKSGSPEDVRAQEMVTTKYFGSGNSPMLPRHLGEMELSLWPDRPKKTLSVKLTLDPSARVVETQVFRSIFRSRARVTYAEIPDILKDKAHVLHEQMALAAHLSQALLEGRRADGALVLYDLNNGWVTTEEGFLHQIKSHEATVGYVIIQELMILANAAVARWAIDADIPVLFRNHVARAATPPDRQELMNQLRDAVHTPMMGLEAVRERTHMLLGRAEYNPHLRGHYGLNLPAYLHFTSPIRRYADLVVHRQIRAFVKKEPFPYTQADLDRVAAHINEVAEKDRASKAASFKGQAEERAQRALDARKIDGLHPKDFERIFKISARSGNDAPPELVEAVSTRLRDERVTLVCSTLAFVTAPETPGWMAIRAAVVERFATAPENAVSLLTMATQLASWPALEIASEMTGPQNAPTFSVTARLSIKAKDPIQATCNASSQTRAKQGASLGVLSILAGIGPPKVNDPRKTPSVMKKKPFTFDQAKDPVSTLLEYGQQGGETPLFSFVQEGPSHIPTITCTCSIGEIRRTARAGSKKDAKKLAASMVVADLAASEPA